mmetsp:Transcript_14634/g.40667  ORF Transcript_14634/g.40667 Transcript_14634/m.40667 type:complete len:402 (-) Transcript_14634:331-1536(-)
MDAIVQLIRNALCCVKDWELFSDSIPSLYDPAITNGLLNSTLGAELPDYVNKTTPLEVVISITQLYACLSCAKSGCTLAWTSSGKLKRLVRLLEGRLSAAPGADASSNQRAAHRIVNESLVHEAKSAMRNVFVGLLVAPIGFAFFWLFANSWHVTEAGWIGGLTALIDALTVMELCLMPLLYYMVVDGLAQFRRKKETEECIGVVSTGGSGFNTDYVNVTRYELMEPGWVPFYEGGVSVLATAKAKEEETAMAEETKRVEQTLDLWFAPTKDNADDAKEKDAKIRREALDNALSTMKGSLVGLSAKGQREFLYLVLNSIAFYGYLMAIVCFYYPDDEFQPGWIRSMKFGYENNFADWSGNFAGDLMWTIEPMVILGSPYYLASLTTSATTTSTAPAKAKTE